MTTAPDRTQAQPDCLYATPRQVEDLSQCWFYHRMDLPGVGTTEGHWDLRDRVDAYLGKVDLSGQRVLDVGTASGFLTFEMEKRGAEVVSFDAVDYNQIQFLPFKSPELAQQRSPEGLERLKNSYWYAHRLLESRAQAYYGSIYEFPESLGQFDVVVVGQILVHIRDPIGALTSIVDRCAKTLIIAEGIVNDEKPYAAFLPKAADRDPSPSWWHLSLGLYREVLEMMGFAIVQTTFDRYPCIPANADIGITTLVCERQF